MFSVVFVVKFKKRCEKIRNVPSNRKTFFASSLFSGCPVDDIPYLRLGEIDVFDKARKVFLRATVRIEDTKR